MGVKGTKFCRTGARISIRHLMQIVVLTYRPGFSGFARHVNVSVRYFSLMSYTTDVFYLSVNLPFYFFH